MISYGFDHYVWQPDGDPGRGVGLFFNFGAMDGNPNPVEYSYQLGLGGKGAVPRRPRDTFGVAWARTQFSDDFVPFLRERLALGLEEEDAVELFYNAAITHWLSVSPSIQIVDAGLERALDENRRFTGTDTAAVFYLRTLVRF
jgi:porin